jgi:hypothetical protein
MRKADELRSDLGEHDNRLFLPSPKETKVAKALGHPKPTTAEGGADLKPLFEEAATGDDTAGEGGGGGAELVTPPTARKTAPKPRPRTVRSETSSLPNLNKQVVDSTIASHLIETLRGIHERLTSTLFRRSSQLMTGAGGPQLSLPDLNPVVGAQIRGVVEGQLALLYTARATATHLARNGSRRANIIADSLSEMELGATVFSAVQEASNSPSPLDIALGIPPFGRIAMLAIAPLLIGGTSELEGQLTRDCKEVRISGSGDGQISINLGSLKQTLAKISETGAMVDYRDAAQALVDNITDASSIVFEGTVRGKLFKWESKALEIAEAAVQRQQRGALPNRDDFDDIVQVLKDADLAAAGKADLKREARRGASTSVFSVSSSAGASIAEVDDPYPWYASVYSVRFEGERGAAKPPPVPCRFNCGGANPPGSFLCVKCKIFLADVHPCTSCGLPARVNEKCRIWFCNGTAGPRKTSQGKLATWAELWVAQYLAVKAAKAKSPRN